VKVLIIPEDPTLDQHILKPIVERLFADLSRPARVWVLNDPHLGGVNQALDGDTVRFIVDKYPMVDLFLLMVDRDGDRLGNTAKARQREADFPDRLLACLAIEEVEVWMLALHRDELRQTLGASWSAIRAHHDPKDAFAAPFIDRKGWALGVGRGRKEAMRSLSTQWTGLLTVCEELAELKQRIASVLKNR